MATFKAMIKLGNKRSDGTWNVVIRFTHNGKVRYIPTTMYVTRSDLTASFKIKNAQIVDRSNELIKAYREKINELNLELNDIPIDSIIDYLKKKNEKFGISFTDFAEKWITEHTEIKGIRNYKISLNAYKLFVGRENIFCDEITVQKMKAFEETLKNRPRAQSLYPMSIIRIFNEARDYYNDEDNDIIRIKNSLRKYKIVRQNVAKKRALDVKTIRKIFSLPYDGKRVRGHSSCHDLALDCFRLSFCLMGMNSADLYNAIEFDGKTIFYERTKTKDRRNDSAKMEVDVPVVVMPLVEKYRGKERVFNFYERFYSMVGLNHQINIGLKEVGKELGIECLQFYAARHSMATIAVNDCKINKYIVNDMLCHVSPDMRVTELYIKKDFSVINDANRQLMEYVFG